MNFTISEKIAEFVVSLTYDSVPRDVIEQAKLFLFDSIACAIGGRNTTDVRIMLDFLREMGGNPEATVLFHGDQIPAYNATLINSLMVRTLDFNDIYWKEDPSHPSDLIPAALAMGERVDASMKEVLLAIIVGYEFEQRFCELAKPGFRERKWHHATITQFVSPLVAGKVMGLDRQKMTNAIGISGCHNHTIGSPTAGSLTMMKNTVDPMAVQAGVRAAILADKGYSGPREIIDGKEGLFDVFGPDWDVNVLTESPGKSYRIRQCGMKAFPTEALTHTHISAALQVQREHQFEIEDIDEIEVTTIARAVDILFDKHKYEPQTRESADHSLPYCIARALIDRTITTDSFSEQKIHDPILKNLIVKIKGKASLEFEKMFPEKQPSQVMIKTKDGRSYSAYLEFPKGDPRNPMTVDDVTNKFRGLAGSVLDTDIQNQIRDRILSCETMTCRDFMEKMILHHLAVQNSLFSGPVGSGR